MGISNQANYILDYITVPISGYCFFIVVILFQDQLGVNVFPIAQIIGGFIYKPNYYYQILSYFETTFYLDMKKVIMPTVCLLANIIIIYYFI